MVTVVVLHVPSLWHHPVEPVTQAVPERTDGKLETIPTLLVRVALIVAAVTGVVGNHRPTGKRPQRKEERRDKVGGSPHGR